jgi:hypothetical protein
LLPVIFAKGEKGLAYASHFLTYFGGFVRVKVFLNLKKHGGKKEQFFF